MTPEQQVLLRDSFVKLVPLPKRFGHAFYERLFELDPSLRTLFRDDLDRQASMLANALTLVVVQLAEDGRVPPTLRELGRRHRGYGVSDLSYETFDEALAWTFEQRLGDQYTPELREAWNEAYRVLSTAMRQAAED